MEDTEFEEKFEKMFEKKMTDFEEINKPKKFTLRWVDHIGKDGEEMISEAEVDWWMEDLLQSQFIILGGDNEKSASVTFPANHLRCAFQNFGFNEDLTKFKKVQKERMAQQHRAKRQENRDVA